jgi:PKD repeat protein
VAFVLHRLSTGGLKLDVRSSIDFGTNLASSINTITAPGVLQAMKGFRSSGGNAHLYLGDGLKGYVLSLDCATAPSPATAVLAVDRIPTTGTPTSVPDGGNVFIGDQLRIKPSFTPPDAVSPLLDWRLDYDFHDGNLAESQTAAMRLINPDESRTEGPTLPPAELTLVGPCDPAQVPQGGSAPNLLTGEGCWTSVTTNGDFGVPLGTADFSAETPAEKQLTIGLEVANALNAGGSSVAKHRITWKVPQQKLASTSILSGGGLTDASDGSPATTGFLWYFAAVPVGTAGDDQLTLEPGCTGPTCNPDLQEPGDYRYWVSVPYRGGFRTPDCPGLDGDTCTGLSTKTVKVTDVVLTMTAPTQLLVGTATFNVNSTSQRASGAGPCPATSTGFTYNFCEVSLGACAEGTYVSTGVVAPNAFPGTITLPTPSVGTWGLRIRYAYATGGSCVTPKVAQWPADGGWSQLTVLQAVPSIHLRNSSDTADIPKSLGFYWELTAGVPARAYADLNGIRDTNPPPGLSWSYRVTGSVQETQIGTTQGASFTVSTPGDYEIILRGYGSDVVASFGVSASGGGGGGGGTGPPVVSSLSASPSSPSVGQTVFFSCGATQGGAPITSYDWVLDSGVTRNTSTASTTYVYTSQGAKTYSCTANDSTGASSNTITRQLTVSASTTGSCTFEIKNSAGAKISYDPVFKLYEAVTGQPLTFEATGATGTIGWSFGNGATGSGNPASYTYTTAGSFTVTLTATGCSTTANIEIASGTFLDFSVADAGTGAAVARTGNTWEAAAGQRLKFTATGTTGAVSWNFGDGETSTLATPEKTYAPLVDTPYTVTLTNGTATKVYTVAVKGSTGAPLTGNYTFRYADGTTVNRSAVQPNKAITFTAADQATTYTWDFGDGSGIGQGSPREHTFTSGGTFAVRLTVSRTGVPGTVSTASPLSFVVLPPPDPLLWVAGGMAYADGQSGERWQSDLSIHNPGTQAATVSLAFVAGAGWDGVSNVVWRTLGVGPGETRAFSNILSGFFAVDKGSWGVVLVRGDSIPAPPVIVSRTYNAANAEETGTFGLSVPAMSVAAGVRPQSSAGANYLAGLRHDAAFRTNLTVANLKDETAEVEVIFRDASGNVLGSPAKVTVEARGVKQLNAALSAAPAVGEQPIGGAGYAPAVSHFSAEVKLKRGSGVYPYATVIDQGTGDSIVVAPTARPSATYRLPGIVRVKGKNGAYWVSDVAILNPTSSPRRIRVTYSYVKTGTTLRIDASQTIDLAPYQLAVGIDFVKLWLGLEEDDPGGYASSYVDVAPASDDPVPDEPLVVAGKTYTPSGMGSVGLQVDPFVLEDGVNEQSSRRKLVLSGLEANARYRTNVALFLTPGSTGSVQVDVHVLDSFGRESKKISFVGLDPANPFVQFDSSTLFAGFSTDDTSRATVVIDSPRGSAYLGAYATVIDNVSEDATFVAGQPAP